MTYAYRFAVELVAAVGAVPGGGDPVFLELGVDELRAADVTPVHVSWFTRGRRRRCPCMRAPAARDQGEQNSEREGPCR